MTMRTVTLELLRHGPAHNQLLSPLTPYLALCGNHGAETVHVGFEHLQFARYIAQLRYTQGMQAASFALQDAAREVSRLLESIRSLTAELSSSDPAESRRMIHFRLVLSASELALLPFELATAHAGMPGQGQQLSLQTASPVCLTREVRRVASTTFSWPHKPRILMVTAAPGAVSAVPAMEHLAALKAALSPYLVGNDPEELAEHLTLLSEATLEGVRAACAEDEYTHVHILAHGMEQEGLGGEARYGLAFHAQGDRDAVDVVSGARLASALRCHSRNAKSGPALSSPTVVSVASCDSANQGSVVAPGASIAHALHEQGIPLVVGSQFPLSIKGSIVMAELLYRRLLAGDDPRRVIHDLRQALHTAHPENNDWASVVVYAAFPNDLQAHLHGARFARARVALDVVLKRAERLTDEARAQWRRASQPAPADQDAKREGEEDGRGFLGGINLQLEEAMAELEANAPAESGNAEKVEAVGRLANAWKQVALFLSLKKTGIPMTSEELSQNEPFRNALARARKYYYDCYRVGISEAWPLVQYLALTAGLGLDKDSGTQKVSRSFRQLWIAASVRADETLKWGSPQQKSWAHGSRAELALLSWAWRKPERCRAEALRHVDSVIEIAQVGQYDEAGFDMGSVRRQLARYVAWNWGTEDVQDLALELAKRLKARRRTDARS